MKSRNTAVRRYRGIEIDVMLSSSISRHRAFLTALLCYLFSMASIYDTDSSCGQPSAVYYVHVFQTSAARRGGGGGNCLQSSSFVRCHRLTQLSAKVRTLASCKHHQQNRWKRHMLA